VNRNERVRVHIWLKGRVQGVGFRAHVEYCARQAGQLTGWVRNVGYEEVESVAEGPRERVEHFIELVKAGPRPARIDEARVEWEAATGEFSAFEIRRSM